MTANLLLPIFLNLAIATPELQQGQAVEAVFKTTTYDAYIDSDPVQARAASFNAVPKIESAFPWSDRQQLMHAIILQDEIKPTVEAPDLSWDIVDSDPVASRGF